MDHWYVFVLEAIGGYLFGVWHANRAWLRWAEKHQKALDELIDFVKLPSAAHLSIEQGLSKLGSELTPPIGWEDRVLTEIEKPELLWARCKRRVRHILKLRK